MVAQDQRLSNPQNTLELDEKTSLRLHVLGGRMLRLHPDPSLKLTTGDYKAVVDGDKLKIPVPLFEKLAAQNIHTAEQFVAACQSAPLSVAMTLDWSLELMEPALQKLTTTLKGHVLDSILHPGPPIDYPIDKIH